MTRPQVILDEDGSPAFAVMPWLEYERLAGTDTDAELSDEDMYDRAEAEGGESSPIAVADRPLAEERAVRVYRDRRDMTQKQLAETAGINVVYLSQIETGKRTGPARTLAALAADLEDLIRR